MTDCFVPVVETLSASEVQASSAKMSGRLEDAGGLSILERGLILGADPFRSWPIGRLGHSGSTFRKLRGIRWPSQQPDFDGQILSAGLRENSEGIGYGLEKALIPRVG